MAPIRRYLRITKYSVLEVRIYLDNPALAHSWLLNPRAPVLPKVIESVRHLVLPKLREEKERARKKSTKKKAIKDVVVQDDFEVAIFLTETNTRHSILFKHKHARDKTQTRLRSNSKKLTGGDEGSSRDAAIEVGDEDYDGDHGASGIELIRTADGDEIPILRREEESDDGEGGAAVSLYDIPEAPGAARGAQQRGRKRRRGHARGSSDPADEEGEENEENEANDAGDGEYVVVDSEDEEEESGRESANASDDEVRGTRRQGRRPPAKRARGGDGDDQPQEEGEKKKKVAMDISYEGFAIYGRVLCLVVKKRTAPAAPAGVDVGGAGSAAAAAAASSGSGKARTAGNRAAAAGAGGGGGQARMENWIASTQMPAAELAEEG